MNYYIHCTDLKNQNQKKDIKTSLFYFETFLYFGGNQLYQYNGDKFCYLSFDCYKAFLRITSIQAIKEKLI